MEHFIEVTTSMLMLFKLFSVCKRFNVLCYNKICSRFTADVEFTDAFICARACEEYGKSLSEAIQVYADGMVLSFEYPMVLLPRPVLLSPVHIYSFMGTFRELKQVCQGRDILWTDFSNKGTFLSEFDDNIHMRIDGDFVITCELSDEVLDVLMGYQDMEGIKVIFEGGECTDYMNLGKISVEIRNSTFSDYKFECESITFVECELYNCDIYGSKFCGGISSTFTECIIYTQSALDNTCGYYNCDLLIDEYEIEKNEFDSCIFSCNDLIGVYNLFSNCKFDFINYVDLRKSDMRSCDTQDEREFSVQGNIDTDDIFER